MQASSSFLRRSINPVFTQLRMSLLSNIPDPPSWFSHEGTVGLAHGLSSGSRLEVPKAVNDPVRGYMPGSSEREEVQKYIREFRANPVDIPVYINGKEVRISPPPPSSSNWLNGFASHSILPVNLLKSPLLTNTKLWWAATIKPLANKFEKPLR